MVGSGGNDSLRILLCNDDGIFAPGICMLAQRLSDQKENDVYVVAPDRERSATGHGLTIHKPLRVEEVELGNNIKGAWSTTGTPSDCIKFAVIELLRFMPDVIISGINSGANLGSELLYSGTVAAAMEGAYLKIPSIAVSLCSMTEETKGERSKLKHYETAAVFIAGLLKILPQTCLPQSVLLNINVPDLNFDQIRGIAITEVGIRLYHDYFEKRIDPRGRVYYWLAGHALEEEECEGSDAFAVSHNMISISPLSFNLTDRKAMLRLEQSPGIRNLLASELQSSSSQLPQMPSRENLL